LKEMNRSFGVVVGIGRRCLLSRIGMLEMGIGRKDRRLLGEMSRDQVAGEEIRRIGGGLRKGGSWET
jgi:hypothetical protein